MSETDDPMYDGDFVDDDRHGVELGGVVLPIYCALIASDYWMNEARKVVQANSGSFAGSPA